VVEQQFRELREDEEHLREGSADDDATHARSAGELSAKVDLGALKMLMLRAKVARQVVVCGGVDSEGVALIHGNRARGCQGKGRGGAHH
jgi:hypothetical protein